jgi:glycerophosphoryl diester phosphodiesterase
MTVERPSGADALIVAHRGAWGPAPQNSLDAFDAAVQLGCDAIELDVRRTVDGQLVVVHDARVRGQSVGRLAHDEVRARMQDGQAPSLDQVLEHVGGRITLDVELKESGYVERAMDLIAGRLQPDQYVVTSFQDSVLAAVKRCGTEARTGLLLGRRRRMRELELTVRHTGVDFLAPHFSLALPGLLDWAHDRGLASWVWTVNDPRLLRLLQADHRVAAVITDRPERAIDPSRGTRRRPRRIAGAD